MSGMAAVRRLRRFARRRKCLTALKYELRIIYIMLNLIRRTPAAGLLAQVRRRPQTRVSLQPVLPASARGTGRRVQFSAGGAHGD